MTPYRFAFLRIAFGFYLANYYYLMSRASTLPESAFIYWGLVAISALLLVGYRRQLVARSLLFFSYFLFAFERSLFNLESALVMLVIVFFALVDGNEPLRIKTADNKPSDIDFGTNQVRLKWTLIFEIVLFVGVFVATYLFQLFTPLNLNSWSTLLLLAIILIMIYPAFLFRAKKLTPAPILFFDGVCGLCNRFVNFVFTEDTEKIYQVAALQGQTAAEKLPKELRESLSTVVVISRDGQIYQKSEAVLNILYDIGGFWRLFFILRILPRPLCDLLYSLIAKFRYKIFGKTETCRLPTSAEKALFLN